MHHVSFASKRAGGKLLRRDFSIFASQQTLVELGRTLLHIARLSHWRRAYTRGIEWRLELSGSCVVAAFLLKDQAAAVPLGSGGMRGRTSFAALAALGGVKSMIAPEIGFRWRRIMIPPAVDGRRSPSPSDFRSHTALGSHHPCCHHFGHCAITRNSLGQFDIGSVLSEQLGRPQPAVTAALVAFDLDDIVRVVREGVE